MNGERKTNREGKATTQLILLIAQCDLLRSFNKHTTVGATAHSSVCRVSGRFLAHAKCIIRKIPPIPFAKFEKKLAIPRYDEASIRVLKGLEPVRQRPGMYTRTDNPLHILQAVIDNAADEALAGFGKQIQVTLHADGKIERASRLNSSH